MTCKKKGSKDKELIGQQPIQKKSKNFLFSVFSSRYLHILALTSTIELNSVRIDQVPGVPNYASRLPYVINHFSWIRLGLFKSLRRRSFCTGSVNGSRLLYLGLCLSTLVSSVINCWINSRRGQTLSLQSTPPRGKLAPAEKRATPPPGNNSRYDPCTFLFLKILLIDRSQTGLKIS
jgi:hypothetical protein